MKIFIYNKNGSKEITESQLSKVELDNRELPKNERYTIYSGDVFPPIGKKFINGELVSKTDLEKYNDKEITKEEYAKPIIDKINSEFDRQCSKVGVDFEGNKFQYDDISRSRLAETKDDERVTFWRSVDNKNIPLSNVKKNSLYAILKETYYAEFQKKSIAIDKL